MWDHVILAASALLQRYFHAHPGTSRYIYKQIYAYSFLFAGVSEICEVLSTPSFVGLLNRIGLLSSVPSSSAALVQYVSNANLNLIENGDYVTAADAI